MPSYRVRREAGDFDPEKQRKAAAREAAKAEKEAAAAEEGKAATGEKETA